MTSPVLGSILLGTRDPGRLRTWYREAFGVRGSGDGFLDFGGVDVLMDRRDDVAGSNPEPGRFIPNFHVSDARATAAHLDALGVTWLAEVQERPDACSARSSTRMATTSRSSSSTRRTWHGRPDPQEGSDHHVRQCQRVQRVLGQ
ncbi:MAG TPA: hypothetical protein VGS19_33390 [Streptosporangiaceae bacterium]|nr:hypothetical protein [Streptosporangiaceae bacterium]